MRMLLAVCLLSVSYASFSQGVELYAADAKKVAAALGDDYKIVTAGRSQRLTSLQWMRSAMYVASFALARASWARGVVPPSVFRHNSARCSHSARQRARSAATCFAIKFVIASSKIGRAAKGTGIN
jgi:hypothetical protein